jgi:hypothetical protein
MVLARGENSDVVHIPIVREGRAGDADIIIGPASQITSIDGDTADHVELDDTATIEDLRLRAARFTDPEVVKPESELSEGDDLGLDFT